MADTQFMKAYTIKEVSKKINIPSGTIRQWEKDLAGVLIIPRTKQGARFYTDTEIELLLKIKQMREKNLSKELIRDLLDKHIDTEIHQSNPMDEKNTEVFSPDKSSIPVTEERAAKDYEAFLIAMNQFKTGLIEEVKAEIRNGVRKELIEEVKKELSKGSLMTVKAISDSIYKSGDKTTEQIKELSDTIHKTNQKNVETISEEFKIMADYVSTNSEMTNQELSNLNEIMIQERERFLNTMASEREEFRREIRQRDERFKEMVESFRETASSKEQKRNRWKLWR